MSTVFDVLTLLSLVLFVFGGSTAAHLGLGFSTVPIPRQWLVRVRPFSWIPTVVAASGLVLSAVASTSMTLTLWHSVAWGFLTVGLTFPVTPLRPDVLLPAPQSAGRHAGRRPARGPVSTRVVLLGCGYVVGVAGWMVALATESAA